MSKLNSKLSFEVNGKLGAKKPLDADCLWEKCWKLIPIAKE
jgi:hypothetical protein